MVPPTDERAANRIYNVGESDAQTEADWVHSIGHAAVWDGEVITVPEDSLPKNPLMDIDYTQHLVTDTSRIRAELGYNERVSRSEALHQAINWERANPPTEINPAQFDYAAEDAILAKLKPS